MWFLHRGTGTQCLSLHAGDGHRIALSLVCECMRCGIATCIVYLKMNKALRNKTKILISLRVSHRGSTSHDSGSVRFSRLGSTSRGSCLARFARFARKDFKSMFDRCSIGFKLASDTCSILRPATTRDGSLRPETTGSHGSILTVRFARLGSHGSVLTARLMFDGCSIAVRLVFIRCSMFFR